MDYNKRHPFHCFFIYRRSSFPFFPSDVNITALSMMLYEYDKRKTTVILVDEDGDWNEDKVFVVKICFFWVKIENYEKLFVCFNTHC